MQRFYPVSKAAADRFVRVWDVGRCSGGWTGKLGQRVQKDVVEGVEDEIEKVL